MSWKGASIAMLLGTAAGGLSWVWVNRPKAAVVAPPSPSAVAAAPVAPRATKSASDLEQDEANRRKLQMIERCEKQGGVGVMGYGWKVVCVKPLWSDDPKFPPPEWSK